MRGDRSTSAASASAPAHAVERAARLLADDGRVQLVYLFGSMVQPGAVPSRDIDVGILTDPPLSLGELMRLRADLVAATGARVDLVSLNDATPGLAHEVVDGGRCLYARSDDVETA